MTTVLHKPSKSTIATKAVEATELLHADHKLMRGLFESYEEALTKTMKKKLVSQICLELGVHIQLEEEIFYPAIKQAMKDHDLVPEAIVEHATLTSLIAQIEGVEPDGEMFDAKVKVLCEYVQHHVKEEEVEMFPKAKATQINMVELGGQMLARKKALIANRS
jgi:hemerythrin superfamily protein